MKRLMLASVFLFSTASISPMIPNGKFVVNAIIATIALYPLAKDFKKNPHIGKNYLNIAEHDADLSVQEKKAIGRYMTREANLVPLFTTLMLPFGVALRYNSSNNIAACLGAIGLLGTYEGTPIRSINREQRILQLDMLVKSPECRKKWAECNQLKTEHKPAKIDANFEKFCKELKAKDSAE